MNHFIEVSTNGEKTYLVVHTGSRNLGKLVAEYHQDVAKSNAKIVAKQLHDGVSSLTSAMWDHKSYGDKNSIDYLPQLNTYLDQINYKRELITKVSNLDLAYLHGDDMDFYINDMKLAQYYASVNRHAIVENIFKEMGWKFDYTTIIESVHNYYNPYDGILRKGAVCSLSDFLVPLNMRDGMLILKGKVNEAWNNSAPHGAGRAMSRSKAKSELNLEDFKNQMTGIYSSTINQGTLDEAPDAYKPSQEIIDLLLEQYELIAHVKPIYNFKASE